MKVFLTAQGLLQRAALSPHSLWLPEPLSRPRPSAGLGAWAVGSTVLGAEPGLPGSWDRASVPERRLPARLPGDSEGQPGPQGLGGLYPPPLTTERIPRYSLLTIEGSE